MATKKIVLGVTEEEFHNLSEEEQADALAEAGVTGNKKFDFAPEEGDEPEAPVAAPVAPEPTGDHLHDARQEALANHRAEQILNS